jgi:transcriptional regulator with XRE-family HTH domain
VERIGARLKRLRRALGWSQEYAAGRYAEMKGEHRPPDANKRDRNAQISSWETGKVWPDLQTLHWLAPVYNLTFEQLIDGAVITKNDWLARHAATQEPVISHEDR